MCQQIPCVCFPVARPEPAPFFYAPVTNVSTRLSDEDIERIAKRVVELIKQECL